MQKRGPKAALFILPGNKKDMVPRKGLEPSHLAAHGPEPCASTNSATWAGVVRGDLKTVAQSVNGEAVKIVTVFATCSRSPLKLFRA